MWPHEILEEFYASDRVGWRAVTDLESPTFSFYRVPEQSQLLLMEMVMAAMVRRPSSQMPQRHGGSLKRIQWRKLLVLRFSSSVFRVSIGKGGRSLRLTVDLWNSIRLFYSSLFLWQMFYL